MFAGSVLVLLLILLSCSSQNDETSPFWYGDSMSDGDADSDTDTDVDMDSDIDTDFASSTDSGKEDVCANSNFEIEGQIVDMLIVLDRSASMTDDKLWGPMGRALTEVTAEMNEQINFGMILFPSLDCSVPYNQCAAPSDVRVEIGDPDAPKSIAADVSLNGGVGTCGGTPTSAALDTALNYLNSLGDGNQRFVLLATDGAPNCNDKLSCQSCQSTLSSGTCAVGGQCLDDVNTIRSAQSLADAGYPVYVLGMGGSTKWKNVMNGIAQAGGTGSYYAVSNTSGLLSTLKSITGDVVSCRFDVDWDKLPAGTSRDRSKVNFFCKQSKEEKNSDENVIRFDKNCAAGAGWNWQDEDTVEFCSTVCEDLKKHACPVVTATFGCDSIPVM